MLRAAALPCRGVEPAVGRGGQPKNAAPTRMPLAFPHAGHPREARYCDEGHGPHRQPWPGAQQQEVEGRGGLPAVHGRRTAQPGGAGPPAAAGRQRQWRLAATGGCSLMVLPEDLVVQRPVLIPEATAADAAAAAAFASSNKRRPLRHTARPPLPPLELGRSGWQKLLATNAGHVTNVDDNTQT